MSRESLIILAGVIILFTPYLGVPAEWKMYIYTCSGVVLVVLGYILRRAAFRRRLERSEREFGNESFTESVTKDALE